MEADEVKTIMMAALRLEVEERRKEYKSSSETDRQLEIFVKWMTQPSAQFGVFMCGNCGNGKTTMVKAFQRMLNFLHVRDEWNNSYYGIRILTAKQITYLYKYDYQAWMRLVHCPMLAIDDLGMEPTEIIDFGNPITPIIDTLTIRYDEQLTTIMTTNLTSAKIAEKYGERIIDRLNEMCVKIVFKNPTFRGI